MPGMDLKNHVDENFSAADLELPYETNYYLQMVNFSSKKIT